MNIIARIAVATIAAAVVVLSVAACDESTTSGGGGKSPEATSTMAKPDLAASVKQSLLTNNMVKSFSELRATSPGVGITEIENMSDDTIRVHVQREMDKDEREKTGRWVVNMSCSENPALDVVVIRDASGRDSNYFKSRNPVPNGC